MKRRFAFVLSGLVGLAFFVTITPASADAKVPTVKQLAGSEFISVKTPSSFTPDPVALRLSFGQRTDKDGKSIGLIAFDSIAEKGGCNYLGGKYEINRGKLKTRGIWTTDAGCHDPHEVEKKFNKFMSSWLGIQLVKKRLVLKGKRETIRFARMRQASRVQGIGLGSWQLRRVIRGNDSVTKADAPEGYEWPVIDFRRNWQYGMTSSCAESSGRVLFGIGLVELSSFSWTRLNCGSEKLKFERKRIDQGVRSRPRFEIRAGRLFLRYPGVTQVYARLAK